MPDHAGSRLVDMLWEALDAQYNKLRELHEENGSITADTLVEGFDDIPADVVVAYLNTQGKVAGLAYAVGTIVHPYKTAAERIELVRAELPARWATAYGEEE